MDAPTLFDSLSFHTGASHSLRSHSFLKLSVHRINYGKFGPLNRMVSMLNKCNCFNMNLSRNQCKSGLVNP